MSEALAGLPEDRSSPVPAGLHDSLGDEDVAEVGIAHRNESTQHRLLSDEDIARFEEDGFILVERAFDATTAVSCRDQLWKSMRAEGIKPEEPSTWVRKQPIAQIYGLPSSPEGRRGHPWTSVMSPRLKVAVDQLLGAGAWEDFGCGWWMITFPGFAEQPWRPEGTWHIDGAHFRHYPHSREIGLLPIFLFSDVRTGGGGTALLKGSHKRVADILWARAGNTGLTGPGLSSLARDALLPAAGDDIIETTGSAGDVMLTHPLLLHARSTNLAPVTPDGVRFMCHPAVPLKEHYDFTAAPDTFPPVQRVVWRSRQALSAGGGDVEAFPRPEECDHSAVIIGPERASDARQRRSKRKRKRALSSSWTDVVEGPTSARRTDGLSQASETDVRPKSGSLSRFATSNSPDEDTQWEGESDDTGQDDTELAAVMGFGSFGKSAR